MKTKHPSAIFNARALFAFALVGLAALLAMVSVASDPPTSSITVPASSNQTVSVTWTGTIPPMVDGASDCANFADTPLVDQHVPTIVVPTGVYDHVKARFTFNIKWDADAGNDEILTVLNP